MSTNQVVHREDAHTLVLEPEGGWFGNSMDTLMRDRSAPFAVGERVKLVDFEAEVRQPTQDGRPARVSFRFARPLEDPSCRWVYFGEQGLAERAPPR
ncbi:MAG: hypothetical protein FJ125_01280 [Deltaproteobacteria bacterium]|nr:hypothetical protein [Deltaproteobacteria bacterium]